MKKITLLLSAACIAVFSMAQQPQINPPSQPQIGTPQWAAQHAQDPIERLAGPVYSPQSGNDTLNNEYTNSACGLNYSLGTVRLGQRFSPVGLPQPAGIAVNIPPCATVLKAYLYTEALGVAPSITADLTDPANTTTSYNMSLIGNSIDVCWGMNGTHVWRSDVTASISGPGMYSISGLPVSSTASSSTVDVEGATLLVIYADPYASYTGSIVIDDGCHTVAGGTLTHTMTGFSACANSTNASSFMLVGDMQMMGYTISMNGNNVPQPQWDWWNQISASTSVTSGQNTCTFQMNDMGDCYTLAVAGLYYQTPCQTCTPMATNILLSTSSTPETCNGNGTASVTASGGTGNYSYTWLPGGSTSSTATGLTAGTYTVYVQDGTSCASATVNVGYNGMVLSVTASPISCSSQGSATVNVTGGTGPFSYAWSPSGGTSATASNLAAGTYTVAVTDQSNGCVMTATCTIVNNSTLTAYVYTTPDSTCSGNGGSATAYGYGGTQPYTYLWQPGGQTTQTITGLAQGSYTCTITDSAGCSATASDSVAAYSLWVYTGGYGMYSCGDSTQLYAMCSDPSATFSWSPPTGLSNPNVQDPYLTVSGNITYTVTATSGCGTATDTFMVVVDSLNMYNEQICFVTVDTATNKNKVIWERWNSPMTGYYNIYRETAVSGQYALVGTQPVSQFTTFIDMSSNPVVMANRYVLTTVDGCGNESDTSYHHRTIHLQTSPGFSGAVNLQWTAYEGLPISTYNIFRGPSMSQLTLLTQVAGNVFTYTDVTAPAGPLYYMVEAVHPYGGCSPSRLSQNATDYVGSQSNIDFFNPEGMASPDLQNSLMLSPNPGDGSFRLSVYLGQAQNVQTTIYDNLGRVVYASSQDAAAGTFTSDIDLRGTSAGMYFVEVKTENGTAVKQLVIQ
ncbi:MAG TPA: T9SS type A sorting domain-containing protein [Bacteroidia bacterium]|nr:T9SS type A sorting domain-containing protein [Bacteroidia bacterium]